MIQQTFRICRRSLGMLFRSPLAYVVMTMFLLCSGFFFYHMVLERSVNFSATLAVGSAPAEVCREFWRITGWIFLFIVPIITMGSLAGEKNRGTMELLLTCPMRFSSLVWGKYLALVFFMLVLLLPTLIYFVFLRFYGEIAYSQVAAGYVGILLLGLATMAIGIFVSALTSSEIVAAFATFGMLLAFWFIDAAGGNFPGILRNVIRHFSFYEHYKTIVTGDIGLDSVCYFLSAATLFLFATHVSIGALWRTGKWD